MKELTRAEEQIMHELWALKKAFVNDVLERFPEPKPAYNTVSTFIRILEKKGFVAHTAYGKSHEYYPLVSKEEYRGRFLQHFAKSFFNNSLPALVSSFTQERNLSINELEELKALIEEELKHQTPINKEE